MNGLTRALGCVLYTLHTTDEINIGHIRSIGLVSLSTGQTRVPITIAEATVAYPNVIHSLFRLGSNNIHAKNGPFRRGTLRLASYFTID